VEFILWHWDHRRSPEGVGGGGGCGGMAALWQTSGTATYTGALGRGSIMVEAKYLEAKSKRGEVRWPSSSAREMVAD
jgi:hypothetical protein